MNTTLVILLGLAVVIIVGLFYFYSPFTAGSEGQITLKLGPGNCIDDASCRAYCETHLQECIEWCTENEHVLCGAMANEYLGSSSETDTPNNSGIGNTPQFALGPGGCLGGEDCVIYCQENLQECIEWCESNEHALCEILTNQYIDGN